MGEERTHERWRELQEGGEEDEREHVQREGGEGEEEGGAEDDEKCHMLWINLTRMKVSTGAEIHY